ncbi:MAG: hypothetical protein ACRCWQ_04450 [Bacilli bacterium]
MLQILTYVGVIFLIYIAIALCISVFCWGYDYRNYKKTGRRDHKFPVEVSWQSYSIYLAISTLWIVIPFAYVVEGFNNLKRK